MKLYVLLYLDYQVIDSIDSIVQRAGKRNFNADLTSVGNM